ncbi:aminotransferase class IV [Thermodesulfovibrionales bacterium]|nr:aminotransferase class IV [Thermodesulfovibrionales bacterium]
MYLNNRTVPEEEAMVSVFDHGFLYGDGIYETLRVYGGVVFMMDEHIQRLYRSASLIGLNISRRPQDIKLAIYETLQANFLKNAYVRLTVSRGYGPPGLDPALCKEPTFVVIASAIKDYPASLYSTGIKLIVSTVKRNLKEAIDPRIKSLNFLNNILAKIEAKQEGADDAVMLNSGCYITECTTSNIFFVKDGFLLTPSIGCGILDGITRAVVIELAARNGIAVKEGEFTTGELYMASEVFITNTTMEVVPVCRIAKVDFGVGDVSRLLLEKYRQEVKAYAEKN